MAIVLAALICFEVVGAAPAGQAPNRIGQADFEAVGLAIEDLTADFGERYAEGNEFRRRLDDLASATSRDASGSARAFEQLKREALLANPLLDFDRLIVLKRKRGQLGLPVNHKCNTGIPQTGYDNEIAVLSPIAGGGRLQTLFRPNEGLYVGEIDLDYDGDRLLFTMPNGATWQIHEIESDGSGLRQVSREQEDVDNFDACYLPDGRIVFASTASYHAVPCWHGKERACSIYLMDGDGGNVRQLCFDQDLDLHPSVLPTGQVIYSRWDYSGIMHMYLRPLMVMNPDGTGQRAAYGSNSYWPNALYYPRGIPGAPNKLVAIVAGYHGVPRMGELVLLDLAKGWHETDGIVQRIGGRGKPVKPIIKDNLVDASWPKFLHPYPLSEKYFLVAAKLNTKSSWGIYLVDVFDNIVPICVDRQYDFFEPIGLRKSPRPDVIPDKVDLSQKGAIVYLHDVYAGGGLAGVPRGVVDRLRIVAYEFGYPGMAGPDKIGSGGPWELMRILGTVRLKKDGSAMFRVPANTPLCVQAVDREGRAVQLMRSWFTAMPGEIVSCVGCHEKPNEIPAPYGGAAGRGRPVEITQWYGPGRGFDFEREVQPVLTKYCAGCHNGKNTDGPDLRPKHLVGNYQGRELSDLGRKRLHPDVRKVLGGTRVKYTLAYESLLPFIRRVGIEDDVHMLVPGEYHVDTSELIQMLEKGHHGVELDDEAWRRLYTWIDLNAPCHGSWSQVAPIPDGADKRRREISRRYGNVGGSFERTPGVAVPKVESVMPRTRRAVGRQTPRVEGWPFDTEQAKQRQGVLGVFEKEIDAGADEKLKFVRIPAGEFVMGDAASRRRAVIEEPFWMSTLEITNGQFALFDPSHNSGYFTKRYQGKDGPGLSLDEPTQPAVRVSWDRAMAYCRWLCQRTGMTFTLPTEEQWEYACRAGTNSLLSYGNIGADFSGYANLADKALAISPGPTGGLRSNITAHKGNGIFLSALLGSNVACDVRFDDRAVITTAVGSYRPNAWGLYDMHGNAAEWTLSEYAAGSGPEGGLRKVVRGGSFHDRPKRCTSAFGLGYPAWRRVFNVGFRVVCNSDDVEGAEALVLAP